MNQSDLLDRITHLEAEAARRRSHSSRLRRTAALGAVLGAVAVGLVASAGAAPTTDTTAVSFVSMPAKKVWGNNSIAPGVTESVVVIGGATTVPSNATTVRLDVTVKGAADGTVSLFPAGNEGGGAGHTVSWAAGATVTETEAENIGLLNKVSVKNSSTKAAVVTLTITGYSTQVTAGDINSSGGSAGQVLTDTGEGATWQNPTLPAAYSVRNGSYVALGPSGTTAASLSVPAGAYQVQAATTGFGGEAGYFLCSLMSPSGSEMSYRYANVDGNIFNSTLTLHGLLQTTGGTITVQCYEFGGMVNVYETTILATRVGATTGPISARVRDGIPKQPDR